MAYFLKRLTLFGIPIGLYVLWIFLVDPYDRLGGPPVVSDEIKLQTAYPLNYCLWKMPAFARHPWPNILLGDSRMDALKSKRVKELTGTDYFNFAFGGAHLKEIIAAFWYAAQRTALKHVYIGVDFNIYTDYDWLDRTAEVLAIDRTPALYFINRNVLQGATYGSIGQLMHYDPKIGAVTEDRETFWKEQLGPGTEAWYTRHVYPEKYHRELEKICRYAKDHGTELTFIIFPTHVELQRRVGDFHLEGEYARFKRDIASLGRTYDFDYWNDLTSDKNNFSDPYHCGRCVDHIIREVWSGRLKYGKELSANQGAVAAAEGLSSEPAAAH